MNNGIDLDNIPDELKRTRHWVLWRMENGDRKTPKQINGTNASTKHPDTWATFDDVVEAFDTTYSGIGYVFAGDDPYCGIDLDDCLDDEGRLCKQAEAIIDTLASYSEISPSGYGVKIWVKAKKPDGKNKSTNVDGFKEIEIYDRGRYFAMTGHVLPDTPATIEDRQRELDDLYYTTFGPQEPPRPSPQSRNTHVSTGMPAVDRCIAYMEKMDPAISGSGGSNATLQAACECYRFDLTESDAWQAMLWWNDHKCDPRWADHELRHKLDDAKKKVDAAGDFGCRNNGRDITNGKSANTHISRPDAEQVRQQAPLILYPGDPLESARQFVERHYQHDQTPTVYHHADAFYHWTGSHYAEADGKAIRAQLYSFLDDAMTVIVKDKEKKEVPFSPTRAKVDNVLDALAAVCNLPKDVTPPTWLNDTHVYHLPPSELLACNNGLLHLPTGQLYPSSPSFYVHNALDFDYQPDAPDPKQWLTFLGQLWGDDREPIDALQEWFGYSLTPDTRQQKIMMIVGPKRSGKGTMARVLTALIGKPNVTNPTLASFGVNFGLADLIGKTVAIISDARLSRRSDQAAVAERLLSISGEDGLTIDRKYRDQWTGTLSSRFTVLTNELPRLDDASGALVSRFVLLVLTESFLGREDTGLTDRLMGELPGVLNWAIDGWRRLRDRGRFVQPQSSADALQQLEDLASPISAFVRDRCVVAAGQSIEPATIYEQWRQWTTENGWKEPTTLSTFCRDLLAAYPHLKKTRTRNADERTTVYRGIGLRPEHFNLG
ncbi:MAG: DNA primase [bacterium]|nr:DNA primase [bacterium]